MTPARWPCTPFLNCPREKNHFITNVQASNYKDFLSNDFGSYNNQEGEFLSLFAGLKLGMMVRMNAPHPAPHHTEQQPTAKQTPEQYLLTKKQLSVRLPMPVRTIEKLVSVGVIPALRITPRMVRFELPIVLAALRQYQTATLK